MPVSSNICDWFQLEPFNYRKFDIMTPDWPNDLVFNYSNVVAAPFGGPIAVKQDPHIRIFNTSGQETGKILWNGKLMTMGWSDSEELVCIRHDADVSSYDIFGLEKRSYNICEDARVVKILDAKVFQSHSGTGVAVLTNNWRIYIKLKNTEDCNAILLPIIPEPITERSCWAIGTEERNSYCLVGRETELFKLVPGEAVRKLQISECFNKPFKHLLHISICYYNKNMALYTNTGILWLGSLDMTKKFCEFDTSRIHVPLQIEWITNSDNTESDAVAILYSNYLMLVNKNGNKNIIYDSAICLIAEIDGVRILTNSAYEMIQKVPSSVKKVFAINSQDPSAYLFEAHNKFQAKSHKSDEYLSLFRKEINTAVDECIEAAGYEFCTETQKSLLKATYFGKGFIPHHNPDNYMRMIRILRVLNTLRHPKIAMPLTYSQFMHLQPNVIMGRLVYRKHYAVALQVAKHLKLPESWILEHWAYDKIINDKNDNEVARKITEKFKNPSVEGISFCNIAEKAHLAARNELAIKLLDLEPRASLQVPLLLKLGKYKRTIQSATQSGDSELVLSVLLEIKNKIMLTNFHMIVREYPMALNLYKKINGYKGNALLDIYTNEDDHKAIAEYEFRNAVDNNILESKLMAISEKYSQGRFKIEAELCSDASKLLKLQELLDKKFTTSQVRFYGLSTHDTILQLLRINELKEAEKIRNDFKVPDKRFWWLRLRTMAEKYKWEELEKFAKNKRSPIGYEPFVEVCLQQNNLQEAQKYILKCRDDRKAYWYMHAELLDKAADCAFEHRDEDILSKLRQKAIQSKNDTLRDKVNGYIARI